MLTRAEVITKVQLFVEAILSSGVPLDRVILFGSYAKNNATDDSDIDVALVSSIFNGFGYEDRKYFSKINIKKQFVDIETKTFPSAYFAKGDPFIAEILQTGIELYNLKSLKKDVNWQTA
jgi:uncharacterized protein